jgi:flagellar biosynthesis/type III secretory pathway M-ring protein FliF/YscJ
MSEKVVGLRRAAKGTVRMAQTVAVGAVVVAVAGTAAYLVIRARRRAEEKTLAAQAKKAAHTLNPLHAAARIGDEAREKLRAEIRRELEHELKKSQPLYEKLLQTAARTAATAAVGMAAKSLQQRAVNRSAPTAEK